MSHTFGTLENLKFDNSALQKLPIDPIKENYLRPVRGAVFSRLPLAPRLKSPRVVAISEKALRLIDLDPDETKRLEFLEYFTGASLLPGSQQAAHCYCGYQFGLFAGQLGDGAAMYLGEVINKGRMEIQLKGSGKTPYSRMGDGRKVLRSTIREFLCSEHMAALNIPTTRAGTVITSDTLIERDMFYDGHPKLEKASIVLRISETFLRFGSFEIAKKDGPSAGLDQIIIILANFVISNYYPHLITESFSDKELMSHKIYLNFLTEVVKRTARLVAKWQCVGFCHGVLNTDNMSIVGDTIDYGPYGFMEQTNLNHICNRSDNSGRYSYKNQPIMCKWNCLKLAEALHPVFQEPIDTEYISNIFDEEYNAEYLKIMSKKLGLSKTDMSLVEELLNVMSLTGSDFTVTFRSLAHVQPLEIEDIEDIVSDDLMTDSRFSQFWKSMNGSLATPHDIAEIYKPKYSVTQAQMALEATKDNPQILEFMGTSAEELRLSIKNEDVYQKKLKLTETEKKNEDMKLWSEWLKKYYKLLVKEDPDALKNRVNVMNLTNPKVILRNSLLNNAIESAENDDFKKVSDLLRTSTTPFDDHSDYCNIYIYTYK
eukprot:GHVL01012234.1.p1 GENE.GHVL01012234.1~~GHVL01012234.1.p1  ORF type:complete len:598 (-),score=111.90 GHVL01012234.1:1330-3123(-)